MKRYNISVNGKAYDVAVEEIIGGAAAAPMTIPAPMAAAPAVSAPTSTAASVTAEPVTTGGTTVTSPMPGTIMDLKVAVGDMVEVSQVLVILEAMKMENDIVAPVAGKVVGVSVKKGDSVNSNDLLITIQ